MVDCFLQTVESSPGDFVGTARSGALFASVVSFLLLREEGCVFVCIYFCCLVDEMNKN